MNTETDCGETAKRAPDLDASLIEEAPPAHPLAREQIGASPQSGTLNKTRNDFGKLLWHALSYGNKLWGDRKADPDLDASWIEETPLAHPLARKQIGTSPQSGTPN